MGTQNRYLSVKPYLPHAIVATLVVVVAPVVVVLALAALLDPAPSAVALVIVAIIAAVVAAVIGSALWRRRPESADIGFDQLMLWAWLHRRSAEQRLDRGAKLLGLDRAGTPVADVKISRERQLEVLHDLNSALESKDPYTHGHSQRVERHAYRTAFAMGLTTHEIEDLRRAAALHDVGKIRIPDRILRKPTGLTIEERVVVEEHVVVGAWMVSQVANADVVSAVRHHHERWDGAGYPDGLAGSRIPLYARIIAVADAYDAITSTRPYRVSSDREFAVDVLRDAAGTQFDPEVVEAFVAALPLRTPVAGLLVLLAGPRLVFKEIALWLRKMGAGNLSPAIGTVGAAVMLSSFVAAPAFKPTPPVAAMHSAPQAHDHVASTKPAASGARAPSRRTHHDHVAKKNDVAMTHSRAGNQVLGNRLTRTTHHDAPANPASGGGTTDPAPQPSHPAPKPTHEVPSPQPQPSATPEPSPSSADNDHGDPQPDHGRDCNDHPGDGSAGNDKHCS